MKYKKKPVVVEAMQVPPRSDVMGIAKIAVWLGAGGPWELADREGIDITTLEGVMHANVGDWIIRGVKNELYPCKPDIFASTYEPQPHRVMVCGVDCHPGDSVCNYCNEAPQKGPMAAEPPPGPDADFPYPKVNP